MNNLIQQLKDNEKAFALMSEEMQEKAKELGREKFQFFNGADWFIASEKTFSANTTYRLHPNYADEPDLVECEIREDGLGKFHYNRPDGITNCSLSTAVNYSDFIGYKFADGTVMGSPVKYSVPGITSHGYYASHEDLKTGQALEHHATHVLMRKSKNKK